MILEGISSQCLEGLRDFLSVCTVVVYMFLDISFCIFNPHDRSAENRFAVNLDVNFLQNNSVFLSKQSYQVLVRSGLIIHLDSVHVWQTASGCKH